MPVHTMRGMVQKLIECQMISERSVKPACYMGGVLFSAATQGGQPGFLGMVRRMSLLSSRRIDTDSNNLRHTTDAYRRTPYSGPA